MIHVACICSLHALLLIFFFCLFSFNFILRTSWWISGTWFLMIMMSWNGCIALLLKVEPRADSVQLLPDLWLCVGFCLMNLFMVLVDTFVYTRQPSGSFISSTQHGHGVCHRFSSLHFHGIVLLYNSCSILTFGSQISVLLRNALITYHCSHFKILKTLKSKVLSF